MGTGKRGLIATAVTVIGAVAVLAAPGTAFAAPSPTPTPSPTSSPTTVTNKDIEAVRKRLDALYHDAAVATDAYNAAEEKAEQQSAQIVALAKKIVKGQERLKQLKARAGAAAAAQYRSNGLPDEAQLMLSDNPQEFLDATGRVLQGQRATKALIAELTRTQQDLKQYAEDASAQWTKLEAGRKAKAAAKKKVEQQIAAAEQLESQLEEREKARLAELEEEAAHKAQSAWLDSGILDEIDGKASDAGKIAVQFATTQIGKPYEWGAEGPDSYDCSGLTSQAWASAGKPIPRTSQEQWKQLQHVDIKDMRPGDLIIYFDDASHVAMYLGEGAIVHAPRPGRTVTLAGAGSMPILGVVRPDA
ncbi:C40 family peptidase [Streptomyces griseorubiginosus]|uniref:C40 family peptidase n=1 Tax=Streptomyces griseorubiginosus TaxID=67304 RepID=UPI002E81F403|nr:NlpC/P60 family protein [Streptomyces griseorubiginosus]WUB46087.1 NlpC/P60 family protein [Streptomyces griseorubiginosus]WUB54608.1 NlpC/P60 family protein [Streptomyces griseorubiginosus]